MLSLRKEDLNPGREARGTRAKSAALLLEMSLAAKGDKARQTSLESKWGFTHPRRFSHSLGRRMEGGTQARVISIMVTYVGTDLPIQGGRVYI
jgi:hypothetical protein